MLLSTPFGILHAYEFELMVVTCVADIAKKYNQSYLWFECYSTSWRFLARWARVLNFLATITFKVSHIYKEGNQVADKFACHAVHLPDDMWWFNPLAFCTVQFAKNFARLPFYRFRAQFLFALLCHGIILGSYIFSFVIF